MMTDLQGLQTRVENARQVFDQTLTERQTMRAKIAELIAAVEQGVKEKNLELERRNKEVENLRAENVQLQSLLSNLLSTVEAKRTGASADGLSTIFGEVARLAKSGTSDDGQYQAGQGNSDTATQALTTHLGTGNEGLSRETTGQGQNLSGGLDVESLSSPEADSGLDWDEGESSWEVESEAEFEALHDLGKKAEEIVLSIPDQDSGKSSSTTDGGSDDRVSQSASSEIEKSEDDGYDPEMSLDDILSRVDSIKSA